MTSASDDAAAPPSTRARIDRGSQRLRRVLLRRRRLLAALLAALAVGATLVATHDAPLATVPVLVAARDLPAGTLLGADDVTTVGYRAGTPPNGALDDPGAATGRFLAGAVGTGEPITPLRLVGEGLATAQPGRTAVPLRLPDPGMVALLEVGDLIDLVATDPADGGVTTLAAGVPVLALPRDDPGGSASTSGLPGSLLVVGLTPSETAPVAAAALSSFVTYTWSER